MPLDLLKDGDRGAVAAYIAQNAPLIRRRLRGKIARSLRTLFDSDDLMATISRRLDDIVRRRQLNASSEAELWSLLEHLAVNALTDLARRAMRDRPGPAAAQAPAASAAEIEPKFDADDADSLLALCLMELRDETDQRILRMRLDQHTHAQIAAAEGVSEAAARKRWQRIRSAIRAVLGLIGPSTLRPPAPRATRSRTGPPGPSDNPTTPHAPRR